MIKMCMIVFSTNRQEYLVPTMESMSNLDFSNISLKKILIDDYPLGRNDQEVLDFARRWDFDAVILHEKNMGITATWTEIWESLRGDDFDYILMHEDDVLHTEKVRVADFCQFLEDHEKISQVQFGRDTWYEHEEKPDPKKHKPYMNYSWETSQDFFWMMCSICRMSLLHEDIKGETGYNLAEGVVAWHCKQKLNQSSAIMRGYNFKPLIEHIGDVSVGIRLSEEGEPGWERLGGFQTGKKYCSRTGVEIK